MTALITWSAALSVGVRQFDDEHRVLLGLVNELHEAMTAGTGHKALGPILDRLFDYTQTHFASEEAALALHGYPGLQEQIEQHRVLVERVAALRREYQAGKILLSVEVMAFLREWLLHHIQGDDAQYGAFLNAKGIR